MIIAALEDLEVVILALGAIGSSRTVFEETFLLGCGLRFTRTESYQRIQIQLGNSQIVLQKRGCEGATRRCDVRTAGSAFQKRGRN